MLSKDTPIFASYHSDDAALERVVAAGWGNIVTGQRTIRMHFSSVAKMANLCYYISN